MALPSDRLHGSAKGKGKAVLVVHTWKDFLYDMGSKTDIPPDTILTTASAQEHEEDAGNEGEEPPFASERSHSPNPEPPAAAITLSYTPDEVTELLNKALLQAISTTLTSLPSSSFPIPATLLYTNHILPSRPAFPTLVVPPASWAENPLSSSTHAPHVDTEITIKASRHKSLTAFLKAAEKSGLLTLKPPQKQQPDILITSVNASHPDIIGHTSFVTVRNLELKAAKKAAREEKQKESQSGKEVEIRELWKPHQFTIDLFDGVGGK
jgi:translation initiation factor 2D